MSSWPFLFAAALAIWLLLKGPAAKGHSSSKNSAALPLCS